MRTQLSMLGKCQVNNAKHAKQKYPAEMWKALHLCTFSRSSCSSHAMIIISRSNYFRMRYRFDTVFYRTQIFGKYDLNSLILKEYTIFSCTKSCSKICLIKLKFLSIWEQHIFVNSEDRSCAIIFCGKSIQAHLPFLPWAHRIITEWNLTG